MWTGSVTGGGCAAMRVRCGASPEALLTAGHGKLPCLLQPRVVATVSRHGRIAQLVRAPASHAGGPWFKSRCDHSNESVMPTRARDPRHLCCRLAVGAAALALCATLWPPAAQAQSEICHSDDESIAAALAAIRHAVDPCGESAQIGAVLDGLERCSATGYRICTSPDALRNVFDRPLRDIGEFPIGTIVWNPQLRSEL